MRQMHCFDTIQVIDASEFESFYIPENASNFGILCLSQSGETKDVSVTIDACKERGITIFSVVNVVGSCISHKADCGVFLNSGREVGVAATKSFTSQCLVLSLISIWFAQNKGKSINKRTEMIKDIRNLHININSVLDQYHKCKEICKEIMNTKSIFLLGTKSTEAIAREGALKIKELSYIHAEGYPSAALKHGTFALIEEGTPIIFIKMGDDSSRIEISAAQTICRGSLNILITDNNNFDKDNYHHVIIIPQNSSYSSILSVIPLQMIAYCLTILKNLNPDRPKNLAKTVTTL
jgi:glucosamine--fructose-6-phosphate aminotransferase (isomerizing)